MGTRPRVSGPGAEPGKIYVTQTLQKLLLKAQDEAERLKDDYVSVEQLMLALADAKLRGEFEERRKQWLNGIFASVGYQHRVLRRGAKVPERHVPRRINARRRRRSL